MAGMSQAGVNNPPVADLVKESGGKWTTYDWNASLGRGGSASFHVDEKGQRLHILAATPDDARFVHEVTVEPATVYHFSGRVRTENVGTTARGAGISVTGILDGSRDVKGTSDWQSLEFYGKTGPEQHKVSVTVGVGGYGSLNSGSAWFEGIRVEKAGTLPPGVTVASLSPLPVSPPAPPAEEKGTGGMVVAGLLCLGVILVAGGIYLRRRSGGGGSGHGGGTSERGGPQEVRQGKPPEPTATGSGGLKKDVAVMAGLTFICLAVSLFNLGGHASPETGWQPALAGESVTVELGKEADLARVYYFCGINERSGDGGQFTFSARRSDGSFVPFLTFTKNDTENWKYADVAVRTSAVRLTADKPNSRLNEIAFVEKGSLTPLKGLRISDKKSSAADQGGAEELIDEQGTFEYSPSFKTGFYFDEIYHGRTAWEMLHGIEPYETTHPPLGKEIISAGIALFGMNAFGWRIAGALFGVALVPLVYLFGLKLFRNRFYAFCAAFLMAADFMRFAQSRLAVIDVFGVFFIVLMYYFILDLFPAGDERAARSANASLLMAGVTFGIGAACKWIAVYAGGGMLLLVALRTVMDLRERDFPAELGAAGFLLRRGGACLLAFVVIPVAVYLLAYVPYMSLPGYGHDLAGVFRLQEHMYNYHHGLKATHPFSSQWWSWPLDLKPMWMYVGSGLAPGTVSTIASFGNPAIWWLTIPAIVWTIRLVARQHDARLGLVLIAFFFQYLPWMGINRLVFIYHFFSSVPFVIFCIVAMIRSAEESFPRFRAVTWGYLAVTAGLFCLFYPVLSGLPVQESYVAHLRWLPTWLF